MTQIVWPDHNGKGKKIKARHLFTVTSRILDSATASCVAGRGRRL